MFIYTLTDPRTNIVRYIGKTKNIDDRYRRHLQKSYLEKYDKNTYKSNWVKSLLKIGLKPIIEILDNGDEDNINNLEIYWISQFRQWGFNLTNLSEGGEVGVDWTGRKHKDDSKLKMKMNQPTRKDVVQYDLEGNILGEYVSMAEASRETKCHIYLMSKCCKEKGFRTVNGTTFRYKGDSFDYVPYNKNIQKTSRKIIQYDLDGNYINTFDSTNECERLFGSSIRRCCNIKYKGGNKIYPLQTKIVVRGFIFRYEGDSF